MAKVKKPSIIAANSQSEAENLIAQIGVFQNNLNRIEADMNDELAKIKAQYELQAQPFNKGIEENFQAVHQWAEANRDELCAKGVKTVNLATGVMNWRMTPPKVSIKGVDIVLAKLQNLKLHHLLRVKTEINKDAILANPEQVEDIPGIKISQREEFGITPFETKLEKAVANG